MNNIVNLKLSLDKHLSIEEVDAVWCAQLIQPAQVVQLWVKQQGLTGTALLASSPFTFNNVSFYKTTARIDGFL